MRSPKILNNIPETGGHSKTFIHLSWRYFSWFCSTLWITVLLEYTNFQLQLQCLDWPLNFLICWNPLFLPLAQCFLCPQLPNIPKQSPNGSPPCFTDGKVLISTKVSPFFVQTYPFSLAAKKLAQAHQLLKPFTYPACKINAFNFLISIKRYQLSNKLLNLLIGRATCWINLYQNTQLTSRLKWRNTTQHSYNTNPHQIYRWVQQP